MGAGNISVSGKYEGLFYVHYNKINVYSKLDENGDIDYISESEHNYDDPDGYEFDAELSRQFYRDFKKEFCDSFIKKCKSFSVYDEGACYDETLMRNNLFDIILSDNEQKVAVMLIQRAGKSTRLQGENYQDCLNAMRDSLLEQFESISTYAGTWTSSEITRADKATNQ